MCIIMILLITINNLICIPIEALSSTLQISVLIFSSSCSTSASSSVPRPPPLLHCSALTVVEKKSKDFLRSYFFFFKKKRGTFFAPQKRPASHWMACVLVFNADSSRVLIVAAEPQDLIPWGEQWASHEIGPPFPFSLFLNFEVGTCQWEGITMLG